MIAVNEQDSGNWVLPETVANAKDAYQTARLLLLKQKAELLRKDNALLAVQDAMAEAGDFLFGFAQEVENANCLQGQWLSEDAREAHEQILVMVTKLADGLKATR
jgi:hypothetical protein